jgi:Flp pilus assembly protein TadD
MGMRMRSWGGWGVLGLWLLAATACAPHGRDRVIVLGIDGADPVAIDQMLAEGRLPNFARLRRDGAYGRLRSSRPMLSPILWTTIATGRLPADHGIGHFVAVNEKTGEQLPVTSHMRRVQAIWNIVSDAGRTVDVVGWWATWPAETVRGSIVSDHTCYHFLFEDGAHGDPAKIGIVHPPELQATIAPLIRRPSDVGPEEASRFVDVPAAEFDRPFSFEDDLGHFRWALATADTYRKIGRLLWTRDDPDLLMVYIEGVDSTSHLFGHLYRVQGLKGELAAQQRRYGHTVEAMYEYADGIVGDFLDAMDRHTTLLVLSDHGFRLGTLQDDPSKTRDMRRVSERYHRIEGILYTYGNHVHGGRRIDGATHLDITPTVLALLGLPASREMPGHVLTDAVTVPEPARVASYEPAGGRPGMAVGAADTDVDPAVLAHLRALGYLDADSPQGDRNMAAMLFEEGRHAEAVDAYRRLVEANPKSGPLRASLAGALASIGHYDEALAELDTALQLEPVNPEAHHNRGAIYERQGKREAAIAEYREALRYNPSYEPSERALARLGAPVATGKPATPAEQLAAKMAERASVAARKGDYDQALAILADAERIAPGLARVYQYRANVLYLKGDVAGARAALERALAIEPDNALYRENLARLPKAPPAP